MTKSHSSAAHRQMRWSARRNILVGLASAVELNVSFQFPYATLLAMSLRGFIVLSIAVLTHGFAHIFDKLGIDAGVDPGVFTLFRNLSGLLIIGAVWFSFQKTHKLKFKKKYIIHLAILGMISSGISPLLGISALEFTTATNKGIVQGFYAAATMIAAYIFLKERLPKLFYPTLLVMLGGLILLTSDGFLQLPNRGDWILFSTIPLVAFTNNLVKNISKKNDALTITFGRIIFGSFFLILLIPWFGYEAMQSMSNGWLWVILAGSVTTFRIIFFYEGIKLEGPTIAAAFLALSPALTAIIDVVWLGTRFSPLQVVGIVLIIGSALLITRMKAYYK